METKLTTVVIACTIAGIAIPLGAFLAKNERIFPKWLDREFRHAVIAFGGGALLAAVALVLVPEGIRSVGHAGFIGFWLLLGGTVFCILDYVASRSSGSIANLIAMLADFVPESIALGAGFASGQSTGMVLAILIALQNFPEGFNSYRELRSSKTKHSKRAVWSILWGSVFLGPLAGVCGYWFIPADSATLGAISLFASGGILYLVFQDIAPQAALKNRFAPALGSVLGFSLGAVGQAILH